jgi:hypothetical protein
MDYEWSVNRLKELEILLADPATYSKNASSVEL